MTLHNYINDTVAHTVKYRQLRLLEFHHENYDGKVKTVEFTVICKDVWLLEFYSNNYDDSAVYGKIPTAPVAGLIITLCNKEQ